MADGLRLMGFDSHDFEQRLWIRNAIADTILSECACVIYAGKHKCLRCDQLTDAERLFPIQYAQAIQAGENTYGVQPR